MRVDFVKFNRERLPRYRTETTIVSDGHGHRYVRKRPLSEEAKAHVLSMQDHYGALRKGLKGAMLPKAVPKGEYLVFDFIDGTSLERMLLERLIRNDTSGFLQVIDGYVSLLRSYGTTKMRVFEPKGGLEALFPAGEVLREEECLSIADLDLTFDNIIVDKEGVHWITDYEWVFDGPIPLSFLLFRSLYVFHLRHSGYMDGVIDLDEVLNRSGIDAHQRRTYLEVCERFIDMVLGTDRPYMPGQGLAKPVYRIARESELLLLKVELAQREEHLGLMRSQIEERDVEILQAGEIIRSLNEVLADQSELASDLNRKVIEGDLRLRGISENVSSLQAEMQSADLTIKEKEGENQRLVGELGMTMARLEVARMEMARMGENIDNLGSEINSMNDQLIKKQAELMTMSDWAYRMKVRLEYIDSKPLTRYSERYCRTKDAAFDKLRNDGVKGFTTAALKRVLPFGMQQRMVRKNNDVRFEEVRQQVASNDSKILVVFPIIPWDFRWQRPQQIVSRFAKNGYAVVQISMDIGARGHVYANEEEAATDLTIGRLGDNIYQVWLSSENKVNIYHDRMGEGDRKNLVFGLETLIRSSGASSISYLVQFPGWSEVVLTARDRMGGRIMFDCMDDHSGFANNSDQAIEDEDHLLRRADIVVTTSSKLFDKASLKNQNVHLVRNGTDFELFSQLSSNDLLEELRGPTIGYYGAIAEWFDTGIIEHCALKHPDWNFVLIGSTVGCDTSSLERLKNVHLLGEKPYRELPLYLYHFDVCTIPFKISPLTLATNPVKFYEYLSSGKPVVTVRLPELEPYADLCYLAASKEEFCQQLQIALDQKDDEGLIRKRVEFARDNSWDQRFADIRKALEGQ